MTQDINSHSGIHVILSFLMGIVFVVVGILGFFTWRDAGRPAAPVVQTAMTADRSWR